MKRMFKAVPGVGVIANSATQKSRRRKVSAALTIDDIADGWMKVAPHLYDDFVSDFQGEVPGRDEIEEWLYDTAASHPDELGVSDAEIDEWVSEMMSYI